MATKVQDVPVLFSKAAKKERTVAADLGGARLASLGAAAAGFLMLVGSTVDLGVLWILQSQNTPQWEYVAVSNTMDAIPRLVLGTALLYLALYLRGSTSIALYRVLAGIMILLGLFAAGFGAIIVTSYFALVKMVTQPEAYTMLRSIAIKSVALSGLYFVVLVPLGMLGMRRPRAER